MYPHRPGWCYSRLQWLLNHRSRSWREAPLDVGGIEVLGSNVIIKNCNIENFYFGILNDIRLDGSLTVESTTVSNNEIGISVESGFLALKNVLAENNREGLSIFSAKRKVVIDNAYFCNNSEKDIITNPFALAICLKLKLPDKSLPVLSEVIAQFQLKTPSANHWRRMDSVRSYHALISLLSNLFFLMDCDWIGWEI